MIKLNKIKEQVRDQLVDFGIGVGYNLKDRLVRSRDERVAAIGRRIQELKPKGEASKSFEILKEKVALGSTLTMAEIGFFFLALVSLIEAALVRVPLAFGAKLHHARRLRKDPEVQSMTSFDALMVLNDDLARQAVKNSFHFLWANFTEEKLSPLVPSYLIP